MGSRALGLHVLSGRRWMEVPVTAGFPDTHGNVTRKLLAHHRQAAKTEGTHMHTVSQPVSCQSDSYNTASGEPG